MGYAISMATAPVLGNITNNGDHIGARIYLDMALKSKNVSHNYNYDPCIHDKFFWTFSRKQLLHPVFT